MKTHLTLRSTLSNTSWTQRGAAALLLIAALIFTLTLALRPNTHAPASAPAVQQAAPAARNPNMPVIGTGSAYDGSHYGSLLAAPQTVPHVPISGMGSVYDGSHYGSLLAAPQTVPHVPISGMGSAYDGQTHRSPHPVAVPASPALIGSGSAYDGQ
jgi:hypothetical protein